MSITAFPVLARILTLLLATALIASACGQPSTSEADRLYLSGDRAPEVAELFSASMLDARTIGVIPGAAISAFTRVCDALWRRARNPETQAISIALDSGFAPTRAPE